MKILRIQIEYDVGDKVWVMKGGIPTEAFISSVDIALTGLLIETRYYLSVDDSDFYRYEEDLFHTKEELMEAMNVKDIKIDMHKLKMGGIIECIKDFTSVEGDSYKKEWTNCIVRINHNSAIVSSGNQASKNNYRLLYRDEIADNFKIHKIKTKGKVINKALRISNFEDEIKEKKI